MLLALRNNLDGVGAAAYASVGTVALSPPQAAATGDATALAFLSTHGASPCTVVASGDGNAACTVGSLTSTPPAAFATADAGAQCVVGTVAVTPCTVDAAGDATAPCVIGSVTTSPCAASAIGGATATCAPGTVTWLPPEAVPPVASICVTACILAPVVTAQVYRMPEARLLPHPFVQADVLGDVLVTTRCETQRSLGTESCVCGINVTCDISAPELLAFVSSDAYVVRPIREGSLFVICDVATPMLDVHANIASPLLTASVDKLGNC